MPVHARVAGFLPAALALIVALACSSAQTGDGLGTAANPGGQTNAETAAARAPSWQRYLRWASDRAKAFAGALDVAHTALLTRARREAPALVDRLEAKPTKPRPRGYRLLPKIVADGPAATITLEERRYALEALTTDFTADIRDASVLSDRAADLREPIGAMIDRYDFLRRRLRFMEASVAHHRYWQPAIRAYPEFFAERNEVVPLAQALRRTKDPAKATELRAEITARIAPLVAVKGLAITTTVGGQRVLQLPVVTDIEDASFRAHLVRAVQTTWNDSPAALQAKLTINLELTALTPAELYGGNAPAAGATIDEATHLGRFEAGALVITTGAARTHAIVGRYVQLGTDPLSARQLAHEVGHLLGFADAYLRGFEEAGKFGVIVVEWSGLQDDLMGSPSSGRVTTGMIQQLLDAYDTSR